MARYRVVKHLNEGLAVIERDGDTALWARSRLRKIKRCAASGRDLKVGEEAFHPIGNQMYRADRIAVDVVNATPVGGVLYARLS